MPIQNTGAGVLYAATLAEANARIRAGGYNILQTEAVFLKDIVANDNRGGFFTVETGLTADGLDVLAMAASGYFLRRRDGFDTYGSIVSVAAGTTTLGVAGTYYRWGSAQFSWSAPQVGWSTVFAGSPTGGGFTRTSQVQRAQLFTWQLYLSHDRGFACDLRATVGIAGAAYTAVPPATQNVGIGETKLFSGTFLRSSIFGTEYTIMVTNVSTGGGVITAAVGSTFSVKDAGPS